MAFPSWLRQPRFWKWLLGIVLPVMVVALLWQGVESLRRWSRDRLRDQERFQISLDQVECTPPAGLSTADFLAEVRYISGVADRLSVLDPELPRTLADAFARHPWVESVRRVETLPGRQIRVHLAYRVAVLAVPYADGKRAVDGAGVLLPATAATADLPVYSSPVALPRAGPGSPWGDAALTAAARVLTMLRQAPELPAFTQVENAAAGLVLTTPGGTRVVWGKTDDVEGVALRKCDRLLEHCRKHGDLDHPRELREHDLRSLD